MTTSTTAATTTSSTASSTSTSTTTAPPTSTSTTAGEPTPFREDGTLRSLPPIESESPPTGLRAVDVAWGEVGPDWILTVVSAGSGSLEEPFHEDLYLIDPADRVHLLGGWSQERVLQDWSPDGLRIVYTAEGRTVIVHLLEGLEGEVVTGFEPHLVRFTRPTGRDVVIGHAYETETPVVEVRRTDGSLWSTLPVEAAPEGEPGPWFHVPGWLYHDDGMRVVVTDHRGVRLLDNLGGLIRWLPIDGFDCVASRWWTHEEVLVSCTDPAYAQTEIYEGWPNTGRELWAVPVDGSAPRPVGPQSGPGGGWEDDDAYSAPREDALLVDGTLFVETGGCCECGGDLEAHLPDGSVLMPQAVECSPRLLAVRNGAALVAVVLIDGRWRVGVAAVDPDGTVRTVAPELWVEGSAVWTHATDDPPGSG